MNARQLMIKIKMKKQLIRISASILILLTLSIGCENDSELPTQQIRTIKIYKNHALKRELIYTDEYRLKSEINYDIEPNAQNTANEEFRYFYENNIVQYSEIYLDEVLLGKEFYTHNDENEIIEVITDYESNMQGNSFFHYMTEFYFTAGMYYSDRYYFSKDEYYIPSSNSNTSFRKASGSLYDFEIDSNNNIQELHFSKWHYYFEYNDKVSLINRFRPTRISPETLTRNDIVSIMVYEEHVEAGPDDIQIGLKAKVTFDYLYDSTGLPIRTIVNTRDYNSNQGKLEQDTLVYQYE